MAVVTAYAAPMVSFVNKLNEFMCTNYKIDIHHVRCAAHILNLVASVLYNSSEMKYSISAIRNAIKSVRGSSKLEHKLQQHSQLNGEPERKLILDCEIRWNSTFDMLQVALKLKKSLTGLASNEPSIDEISGDDRINVKIIVSLLQPFKHATEEICGDNFVVVSRLYAVLTEIREHLTESSKKSTYSLYKTVIDKMLDKLKDY